MPEETVIVARMEKQRMLRRRKCRNGTKIKKGVALRRCEIPNELELVRGS